MQNIYTNGSKRNYVRQPRYGVVYRQMYELPYVDSTVHKNIGRFGHKSDLVTVANIYVCQETGVLMVVVKLINSWGSVSCPYGQFGHYFRPVRYKN